MSNDKPLYVECATYQEMVAVLNQHGESSYGNIVNKHHLREFAGSTRFQDIDPNVSVRDEFTRSDYETMRVSEKIPTDKRESMALCNNVYRKVGIIHNMIDLMGDFTCQGIRLVHPIPSVQRFYQRWAEKVEMVERSERFSNLLYRMGNVITKRITAKLRKPDIKKFKSVKGDVDIDQIDRIPVFSKKEIPLKYTFLSPLSIRIIGEEVCTFTGKKMFALQLSQKFLDEIRKLANGSEEERALVESLPQDIKEGILNKKKLSTYGSSYLIPLDSDKVRSFHYKKDDNEVWADSLIYSVLPDILHLQKMRLADLAALDGAISTIRLWKLGNLEAKILPTEAAINKLRNALLNNVGGGSIDLVWGPEIDFKESTTNVYEFLGEEKYRPVWQNIYGGMGIPQTLTGTANAAGTTNNFVSLQTLIQKLEYGRDRLLSFWNEEVEIVREAMGFTEAATIQFDYDILSDKQALRALLIQMWDRDIITNETILERFSEDFDIEKARSRRERKMRENGKLPPKADSFHNAQPEIELQKIALQNKLATPSEVGLNLKENSPEDKQRFGDNMNDVDGGRGSAPAAKLSGVSGQGRPVGKKDKTKRKAKTFKPRTSAEYIELYNWAYAAQDKINEIVNPLILKVANKSNLRQLSNDEAQNLDQFKFGVLLAIEPHTEISENLIKSALGELEPIPQDLFDYYNSLKKSSYITTAELKRLQIATYIYQHFEKEEGELDNGEN